MKDNVFFQGLKVFNSNNLYITGVSEIKCLQASFLTKRRSFFTTALNKLRISMKIFLKINDIKRCLNFLKFLGNKNEYILKLKTTL